MKLFTSPIIATVASAAAAAALLASAPPATAVAIEKLTVDTDSFSVLESFYPTVSGVSGTATVFLQGGNVQVSVNAKISKPSSFTGCRAARAQFTYADGSTATTAPSGRVCLEHATTTLDVAFRSTSSKDLVKYAVQLLKATDDDAPMTAIGTSNQLVGDAPDSFGTTARLDHDTHRAAKDGHVVFTGSSNWYLNKHTVESAGFSWWNVRARVNGTLTWNDALAGTQARVTVIWTYTDGSNSYSHSPYVVRGKTETLAVSLVSDGYKEVVSARVVVGGVLGGSTKFGDYLTP
jgi:hypothetical protein